MIPCERIRCTAYYNLTSPHTFSPNASSFLALYEYSFAYRHFAFLTEYGLKAARRAPQFSKR